MIKKALAGLLIGLIALQSYAQFTPGQVLGAAALNAALASPTITGGSINGSPIGQTVPRAVGTTQISISGGTAPSIASSACGAGSNGSVTGQDNAGKVTIGSAATTTCTVTFGSAFSAAPNACILHPATLASVSVLPYTSAIATASFSFAATALASTAYYFHCF